MYVVEIYKVIFILGVYGLDLVVWGIGVYFRLLFMGDVEFGFIVVVVLVVFGVVFCWINYSVVFIGWLKYKILENLFIEMLMKKYSFLIRVYVI